VRSTLVKWAKRDAKRAPWLHPGDPWSVLGDRTGGKDEVARDFLSEFPSSRRGLAALILKASIQQDKKMRTAWKRLANAAAALGPGGRVADPDRWIEKIRLGATEELLVRTIGFGEPCLVTGAPLMRTVGRITDTTSADERRLSDGRLVVARLVGVGDDAPVVSAALNALGRNVCLPNEPGCDECPVTLLCKTSRAANTRRRG
jgi:hypothetical protein